MRNTLIGLVNLFLCLISAQEENKFRLSHLEFGVGGFYNEYKYTFHNTDYTETIGGLCFNSQFTTSLNKNLFALSYLGGEEFDILGPPSYRFHNFNLLYGRALEVTKWLNFEAFARLGYFLQSHNQTKFYNQLAYPLKFNMVLLFNKRKGTSLSCNYLIAK